MKNRTVRINMISITVSLFTVKRHNGQKKQTKQYFYSTKTTSPVLRLCTQQLNKQGNKSSVLTSRHSHSEHSMRSNTIPTSRSWPSNHGNNRELYFFFVLLLSLSFFFMSSFEPKCWKYFKFNPLLKPNPLFYTNTDVEKGVQLDEIGSERGE